MEINQDNSGQILIEMLNKYSEYGKSQEHKEKEHYKWTFVEDNKDKFQNLDNLQEKLRDFGAQNFSPFVLKQSTFRHLAIYHEDKLKESLNILFNEKLELFDRIRQFIEILNNSLNEDLEWRNKDIEVDVHCASFFLFVKNYKKYLLFPKVDFYIRFAKLFSLEELDTDLIDKSKNRNIERYLAWQKYCQNKIIPLLSKILGRPADMLDAQDAIYCISEYLTKEFEIPKKLKKSENRISKEEHEKRMEQLRNMGLIK